MDFSRRPVGGMEYGSFSGGGLEFSGGGFITGIGESRAAPAREEKTKPIIGKYKALTGARYLQGYGALYDVPHKFEGKVDIFRPGCFARSLAGPHAIRFQVSHKNAELLGTTNDDLEVYADEKGLAFRLRLPDTELADEVKTAVGNGTLTGMSTGCTVHASTDFEVKGGTVRVITDASLYEISCCENGALTEAFVNLVDAPAKTLEQECKSGALFETKRKPYVTPLERYKAAMAALGVTVYGVPKHLQTF